MVLDMNMGYFIGVIPKRKINISKNITKFIPSTS